MAETAAKTVSLSAQREYQSQQPAFRNQRSPTKPGQIEKDSATLEELWLGLSISKFSPDEYALGSALHDGTYCVDFKVDRLHWRTGTSNIDKEKDVVEHIINDIDRYRREHLVKMLGAGIETELHNTAPSLASALWSRVDIVPSVHKASILNGHSLPDIDMIDEIADDVARQCLQIYGPTKQPRLSLSFHNEIQVDHAGTCRLATLEDYRRSARPRTWEAMNYYGNLMKKRDIRLVFFSATPQGGGVALMRHALFRFLHLMGINAQWYVPRPRPDIFRITKNSHNILQGVDTTTEVTDQKLDKIHQWVRNNAERFWLSKRGPLLPRSKGGADVIVVDDPQMPEVVRIAKEQEQDRPVVFRSHIEVRDDLVQQQGSGAQKVWDNLWTRIRQADAFISHPVRSFVPPQIKMSTVGWLPATTDWLDGLNKTLDSWDTQYYFQLLRQLCQQQGAPQLAYPDRPYITQIARFDPSKGIPDVLESYHQFRKTCKMQPAQSPQLIICGHGSIDDPDASRVYHDTTELIRSKYAHLKEDIFLARIGPSDQMLNAILSRASVVLQLSTREGFEVKVSEALHKGKPVIATHTGGIPLQIEHGRSGFVVERGDAASVARHLNDLLTPNSRPSMSEHDEMYSRMSEYARANVSDEVHTVGNALAWTFLATALASGGVAREGDMVRQEQQFKPGGKWIADLAMANVPEEVLDGLDSEIPRLPRHLTT